MKTLETVCKEILNDIAICQPGLEDACLGLIVVKLRLAGIK